VSYSDNLTIYAYCFEQPILLTRLLSCTFIFYTAKAAAAKEEKKERKAQQKALRKARRQRLRLFRARYRFFSNSARGDCYTKSISFLLYGTEKHHRRVRAELVNIMRNNPEHFAEYMQDGMSLDKYLEIMSKDRVWCDEAAIAATPFLSKCPVEIYCDSLDYNVPLTYATFDGDANMNNDPICVYRVGRVHFMAMKPKITSDESRLSDTVLSELSVDKDEESDDDAETLLPQSVVSQGSAASKPDDDGDEEGESDEDTDEGEYQSYISVCILVHYKSPKL